MNVLDGCTAVEVASRDLTTVQYLSPGWHRPNEVAKLSSSPCGSRIVWLAYPVAIRDCCRRC
jgi:hypothetical protein